MGDYLNTIQPASQLQDAFIQSYSQFQQPQNSTLNDLDNELLSNSLQGAYDAMHPSVNKTVIQPKPIQTHQSPKGGHFEQAIFKAVNNNASKSSPKGGQVKKG